MKKIISVTLLGLPLVAFGATVTLKTLASTVVEYLNIGIKLIIALAVVVFVWNVFQYFFTEKDRAQAGQYVLYSVIGFFIIFSFWGLVNLLKNSIQLDNNAPTNPIYNIGGGSEVRTGAGNRK